MKAPPATFWIGSDHAFDLFEAYLNFRATLTWDGAGPAVLHITADSRYRLWVNGTFIARGPERSWPWAMAVDRLDLTPHLRPGANALAVQVYSPGYSHFAYVHRAACGLLAWVESDGRTLLHTDQSWQVRRDPGWNPLVNRVSIYGTGVEDRDMGQATDWQTAPPEGWSQARIVQPPEGPIWASLRPRATPVLRETTRTLTKAWQTRLSPTPPRSADPHAELRAAMGAEAAIPATIPQGQTATWIFDLGHSQTTLAAVDLTARGGEALRISHAEKLRDGELLLPDPATYCRMRPTDRFTLRPGRQRAEGFTPRGARYLVFQLDGAGIPPDPVFSATTQSYPLAERPLPDLGPGLNAIARLCRRTILACLADGFVDSIWRESSQWLGDAVPEAAALMALTDDPRPLRFALTMAAAGAEPSGFLPSILPGEVPAYAVTDYNFAWVELLALYATHPGAADADELLADLWPTLARLLDHFDARLTDGLLRNPPGRRLFLDWSPMSRAEPSLLLNLRYLHALDLASDLARRTGRADPWAARARALRVSTETARMWHGCGTGFLQGGPACQLDMALLILTGLAKDPDALADRIVARSLDLSDAPLPDQPVLASPFMHHYLFQALDRLGRQEDIRAIIAARWGRWAGAGEATTWENWDISFPDGSACHGFSAHPLYWLTREVTLARPA